MACQDRQRNSTSRASSHHKYGEDSVRKTTSGAGLNEQEELNMLATIWERVTMS